MIGTRAAPLVALLVEDNLADAELIAMRLESANGATGMTPVRLLHADSAAHAVAVLRDVAPDVVILDLSLPDACELEALHRVREASPGVPVIVLTGSADQAMALQALRAGAQDYVLKPPPDGAILSRILRYAWERQHLLQEVDAAKRAAAAAAERWRLLAEAGQALASSNEPAAAIPEVARLLVPDAAEWFVLVLVGDEEVPAMVEVAHADADWARELRARLTAFLAAPGSGIGGSLGALHAADGASVGTLADALQPVFASFGVVSGTAVPLDFGGRVRGLLMLAVVSGQRDAVADIEFSRSLADRICLALEQERLLQQTRRAIAGRDRLVSVVSHDLRNPLSTIQICATALLDPTPAPVSGIHHMAQLILRSVTWMQQIVRDLLDRASLDAGHLVLNRRPTAIADVIGAAYAIFAPVAEEHAIEFAVQEADDLPRIDVDPGRLLQALSNLLGNALKFTPSGGQVALSVRGAEEEHSDGRRSGGHAGAVRFTVTDTGRGIPPDELAHVFDWFWQSPTAERSGAGIGLAIAKSLVEAHRSRLNVESIPGRGTTFWFTVAAAGEAGRRDSGGGTS
jgi:signal transduction histidine kinase/DNA-binding NarL/FixJ family response regulator